MKELGILGATLSWLVFSGQAPLHCAARPNVALIIIDTLRADKLGCYGFTENTSPELDRLAERGIQFTKVYAQCSWTRPSVGSMLTSLYPRSIGLYRGNPGEKLDDSFLTLPEILKSYGYSTFGVTANPTINSIFNLDQGFDEYIDSDVVWNCMLDLDHSKLEYRPEVVPLPDSARIFRTALDRAKAVSKRPMYVQINVMEVHEGWRLIRPEFKNCFTNHAFHWYLDAIRQMSFDVNRFVAELLSMPGFEDTLFVITSDHGQGLDDHPHVANSQDHGYLLYESQLSVPLILFHSSGALGRKKIDQPVRLMDLMPTILEYLGIPRPDDLHGTSFLKSISAPDSSPVVPEYFISETYFQGSNKIAVHSDQWRYIENRDGQEGVNKLELQPIGVKEDGMLTDKIRGNEGIHGELRRYLESWELFFPRLEGIPADPEFREEEIKQLKALGYLD
ncbi:MAG: sulfatase [Acidobacteria bacterium]|nr:sulfatase [Acidobacteriota bacterium]